MFIRKLTRLLYVQIYFLRLHYLRVHNTKLHHTYIVNHKIKYLGKNVQICLQYISGICKDTTMRSQKIIFWIKQPKNLNNI